jgi:hypothetical protein
LASSPSLSTVGIQDAPLIDSASTTSYVYVVNPYGGTTGNPAYLNVFTTTLSGSDYGTPLALTTTGNTSLKIYNGAFDNRHTTSSNGNYYVCATDVTSGSADTTLYQVTLSGSGSPTLTLHPYNQVSTSNTSPTCSPVTEFYDGTHDWVFLSVNANGQSITGCTTGACLYNYSVPTSGSGTSGSVTAGLAVTGGSSGIIIDNSSASPGSNIYFNSLAQESCNGSTTGCAVQASQAAP